MEWNEPVKIIYEDNGISKVIRGLILKDDEFIITVKAEKTGEVIVIGKRGLIKIQKLHGGF